MTCSPLFTQPPFPLPHFPLYTSKPIPPPLQLSATDPSHACSSSFSQKPHIHPPPHSISPKSAKIAKKPSPSTPSKHKAVQLSLELKVERAKGFRPFFVPLARSMPPAPPSSPVLRAHGDLSDGDGGVESGKMDFFASWEQRVKRREREEWVEDVEEGMEIDSE